MNKERRDRIAKVLGTLKSVEDELSNLASEERDAQESKPEALQNTDAADSLDSAVSNFESLVNDLENIE
jgi:Mg2+ and Co2+ transporter CorA